MASFDIFNDNAFQVSQLTQTIVDIPRVPTLLGDLGIFTEYGISTPTMMIERKSNQLSLVPAAPRGGLGQPLATGGRKLIPISAIHLPQRDAIMADVVYGVREFGSETEVQAMQNVVRERQVQMKEQLDLTLEYHRVGALKGLVLDADGSTTLLDIYALFGFTQEVQFWNIATANSGADTKAKAIALKRLIRSKLGGKTFKRVRVICSAGFFDKLVAHDSMKAAYERWNDGQFLREDQSEADFIWQGVVFTIYEGGVNGTDFVEDGYAYAYPEGVPRMFQTAFAPANYMETVNTIGSPYYTKVERMRMDKGVEVESQSNPVTFNTLPEAVIKLSVAAS